MKIVPRIYDVFESRREFPRLKVCMPVLITRSDGLKVKAGMFDISPDGAKIRYSDETANILFDQLMSSKKIKSYSYTLQFDLQEAGFMETVDIKISPVYQHKISDNEYSMGVTFDKSNKSMKAKINDYLSYELAPALEELTEHIPEKDHIDVKKLYPAGVRKEITLADKTKKLGIAKNDKENIPSTMPDIDLNKLAQEINRISSNLKLLQEAVGELKQLLNDKNKSI